MKRKTPIRHTVHRHKRKGNPVHQYERGKGERKAKISKPRIRGHKSSGSSDNYTVHITYVSIPMESFPVVASSYPDAIELALSMRTHITRPYQITVDKT